MDFPLRIGEATTIMDPATNQPVTVRVDTIEDGKARITVVAPLDVSVTKVREPQPEPPPRVIH